jgi:hypothetical protein
MDELYSLSVDFRHISAMERLFNCSEVISFFNKLSWLIDMSERMETHSENARPIILNYKDRLYYISQVKVHFFGEEKMHKAIFHAKTVFDGQLQDLHLDITRKLYNILVEYTKLDNPALILMLQIEDKGFRWCLLDEKSLRHQVSGNDVRKYIA